MRFKKDSEEYLKAYPWLLKWINECSICHAKGYTPEMPDHIGGDFSIAGQNIRKYFKPLEVDGNGHCLQCARLLNRRDK